MLPTKPLNNDSLNVQWHPTLNGGKKLSDFTDFSHYKAWWECDKRHEWEAQISNIAYGGKCPYCKGKKVLAGFNDLSTKEPEIASQWNIARNNNLSPNQVTISSGKKVWWECDKGHEYESPVFKRTIGSGCPYCANQKVLTGFNDLATTDPAVAAEWHPTKNETLQVSMVTKGSHKKVWWLCNKGHEWETSIKHRTQSKSNCPYCAGQKTLEGYNDFATSHPNLVEGWDVAKNLPLKPTDISFGSSKQKIWWLCDRGHSVSVMLPDKIKGQGCAVCTNQLLLVGYNDLATAFPLIAAEWHSTKNFPLLPSDFIRGSNKKAWWVCSEGHEWETTIASRIISGCLRCIARQYVSKAEKAISEYLSTFGFYLETSNRSILKKLEIDIYVPEKKIAIEFNGIYWHSEEQGKDKNYHYNKWLECKKQGIQLIQIWEDDWNANSEQIKTMLAHKLGVSTQGKVFGRKTSVIVLDKITAENFLNKNHIQRFASGSYYLGLQGANNSLQAVLVLKKEPKIDGKVLNIIRYATSANVIGGFTKLLKYAEKTYMPDSFITFSDHCISNGGLYENNGFTADKELKPDYMYVAKNKRNHKFGYRLKRFKNDPELLWEEGLTESQLAKLNNLPRIWDAGKTRWIKTV